MATLLEWAKIYSDLETLSDAELEKTLLGLSAHHPNEDIRYESIGGWVSVNLYQEAIKFEKMKRVSMRYQESSTSKKEEMPKIGDLKIENKVLYGYVTTSVGLAWHPITSTPNSETVWNQYGFGCGHVSNFALDDLCIDEKTCNIYYRIKGEPTKAKNTNKKPIAVGDNIRCNDTSYAYQMDTDDLSYPLWSRERCSGLINATLTVIDVGLRVPVMDSHGGVDIERDTNSMPIYLDVMVRDVTGKKWLTCSKYLTIR